jgi:hypothetical protein
MVMALKRYSYFCQQPLRNHKVDADADQVVGGSDERSRRYGWVNANAV